MNVKTYRSLTLEDEWDDSYGGFIVEGTCSAYSTTGSTDFAREVSNNLGVYFVFCLFALAILALFLCCSMQALQTNAFFSLFYVAKFGRFLCINNFYRRGTLDFK